MALNCLSRLLPFKFYLAWLLSFRYSTRARNAAGDLSLALLSKSVVVCFIGPGGCGIGREGHDRPLLRIVHLFPDVG